MRLQRFEVTGYKNLRRTVTLDALAGVNVIHGENNVGKSNLLQAIDLFFVLLGAMTTRGQMLATAGAVEDDSAATGHFVGEVLEGVKFYISGQRLEQSGYPADDIFNIEHPSPIELRGELVLAADDWKRAGFEGGREGVVAIGFKLSRTQLGCDVEARWQSPLGLENDWPKLRLIGGLLVNNFNVRSGVVAHGFILVDVQRRVASVDERRADKVLRTIPSQLLIELYDAKESVEPAVFQRWELFEREMNSLGKVVGDGRFVITYARPQQRAILAVQKGRMRLPIDHMGSGVQQIASLLGRMLVANSAIVAVEEPELNLRYELQLRLRDMFREIVESGLGPQQIIVTSHSPAFETSETFYAMRSTDEGPSVERRPVNEAPAFLELMGLQLPVDGAAYGYVSSEGLLRLSEDVRKELGVEHGGGVVVLKRPDHEYVEILSNEEFLGVLHGGGATK